MSDPRPWTYAALFGTLWGAAELSLGTVLNLGQVPLYGMLMAAIGLLCLVTLRRLQPRVGVCVLAGAVAAFLKIFAIGGLRLFPLIGIVGEAVLVELAMTLALSRHAGAILAGVLAMMAPPLQMLLTTRLVAGPEAVAGFFKAARATLARVGLEGVSGLAIVGLVLVPCALIGAAVGHLAWRVAGRVTRRLGGRP
jgi:hypothetical protein